MAKAEDIGFVEAHIEKVVLGGCVLLLALAVYVWVFSSPRSIEILNPSGRGAKQTVSPEQVDEALVGSARSIKSAYDRSTLEVPPIPKYAGQALSAAQMELPPHTPVAMAAPSRPLAVETGTRADGVRLADLKGAIPPPPAPKVALNLELPDWPEPAEVPVAHGVVSYPAAELRAAWTEKLSETPIPPRIIVRNVIVQAQQRQDDGTWGPAMNLDANMPDATKVPAYDFANIEPVRKAREALAAAQDGVLRPDFERIWSGRAGTWVDWRTHLPRTEKAEGDLNVWFHWHKGLEVGKAYRFRVQLELLNPMLAFDQVLGDDAKDDAKVVSVATKPGPWSEPVSVQREVLFFVAGADRMNRQIPVRVFTRKWGQTVAKTFQVKAGQKIGAPAEVTVVGPGADGPAAQNVTVDFSTDAVALRLDFQKLWSQGGFERKTEGLLYLGADGRLRWRIRAQDESDPVHQQFLGELKTP